MRLDSSRTRESFVQVRLVTLSSACAVILKSFASLRQLYSDEDKHQHAKEQSNDPPKHCPGNGSVEELRYQIKEWPTSGIHALSNAEVEM